MRSRTLEILLVFFVTVVGAGLRLYNIGASSLWGDEIFSIRISQLPWEDMFRQMQTGEINMLPYYVTLRYWIPVFGDGDAAIRLPSAAVSIAAIPLIYMLARQVFSNLRGYKWAALGASALLALNSYSIQFAQEARAYSMAVFFVLLATYLLTLALSSTKGRGNPWIWVGYAISITLGVYAHFVVLFVLASHAFIVAAVWGRRPRGFPAAWAGASAVFIAISTMPLLLAAATGRGAQLSWTSAISWSYFYGRFLKNITGSDEAFLVVLTIVLVVIGIGYVVWRWWRDRDFQETWQYLLVILCGFLPLAAVVLFSFAVTPVFVDRYLLITQPFLIILAVLGLSPLWQNSQTRLTVLGYGAMILVGGMLLITTLNYYENYKKEDNRGVALLLSENYSPEDEGILYFIWRIDEMIQHYDSSLQSAVSRPLWRELTDGGGTTEEIAAVIPRDDRKLWLVINRVNNQERRNALERIKQAVKAHYQLEETIRFQGIQVEAYIPN
jgi:mannosyltransferase